MTRLLIVDDEDTILKQLKWAFKKEYEVITAGTVAEAIEAIETGMPQLMILDLSLGGDPEKLEGFDILEPALMTVPGIKVIVITGHDDRENALKALETGAADFYSKPVDVEELRIILQRAAYIQSLEKELEELRKRVPGRRDFQGMIAMSAPMLEVFETVRKVSSANVSVLVTGESGTGKELIARAVHERSSRNGMPFIPINCGAIPENLLESELFGHEKGSFTGADSSRPGKLELADRGTLFLDEIGELPPTLQVKILRFLQDHVIERVGGHRPIQLDVRVIAATNRDLSGMISDHSFREDLFYRINTVSIDLPPLRDRGEDILLLATHFLFHYRHEFSRNVRGFTRAAQESLYSWNWPGNVRELENRVKRGVIMAAGKMLQPGDLDLPEPGAGRMKERDDTATAPIPGIHAGTVMPLREARDDLEQRLVTASLIRNSGNVSASAQELDVSRPTLHDLMKKHGIDAEDFRMPRNKG